MTPLFRVDLSAEIPIPVRATDPAGSPRTADGATFFDLSQAAGLSGYKAVDLEALWHAVMADVDAAIVGLEPEPDGTTTVDLEFDQLDPETKASIVERRLRGGLDAEDWAVFVRLATAMNYNVETRECYPRKVLNEVTGELEIVCVARIEALQRRVLASNLSNGMKGPFYAGVDGIFKRGPWLDRELPVACTITMKRKGVAWPLTVGGTWLEFAGFDVNARGRQTNRFWGVEKGPFMLAKCVEAKGYRQLYRDIVGSVYIPEELPGIAAQRRRRRESDAIGALADPFSDAIQLGTDDPEPGPHTEQECRSDMARRGIRASRTQDAIIAAVRQKFGESEARDPSEFWATVLANCSRLTSAR